MFLISFDISNLKHFKIATEKPNQTNSEQLVSSLSYSTYLDYLLEYIAHELHTQYMCVF